MEIRALSEWNTNISISHAQRYNINFYNFIFTFTFISLICLLLYKTKPGGRVIFSVIGCPDFPQLPCQKNLPGAKKVFPGPNTDAGFCQRIHAMWRSWVGGQFLLLFIDQKNSLCMNVFQDLHTLSIYFSIL